MEMLTTEQKDLIAKGFGHMVDAGYGKIETTDEIIFILEVALEQARREQRIAKGRHEDNPNADTVVMFLEPCIKNLTMRLGVL